MFRIILGFLISFMVTMSAFGRPGDGVSEDSDTDDVTILSDGTVIDPDNFSTKITNKYAPFPIGQTQVYEATIPEGIERVEISISGATREIMNVRTLVMRDVVTQNGELVEDTLDFLAQDNLGNVWYFGEEVNNYENGVLVNHDGSWMAGVDGAEPGLWVTGNPKVGDVYKQEYLPGIAEDVAEVLSVTETVTTKMGTFTNCLKTYDTTPLDPTALEHKYYCPGAGGRTLIEHLVDNKRTELISVKQQKGRKGRKR